MKDAIGNSKAIGNLADNLLLLTMMVILNRRQELPRDRSELYEQATRVLLHHWDVDHKSLQLPIESIGRREKQAMLRCVAYEMQTSESGLKGNLITADRLAQVLTGYLREQGFEAPREKANGLIEQLRSRNWILCDRGADTYGFVHRTFLEYFCAMEIVHRFKETRSLSFDQLQNDIFRPHWQDETWHEVLQLICGALEEDFASKILKYLVPRTCSIDEKQLLFLSSCFAEIRHTYKSNEISNLLLQEIRKAVEIKSYILATSSSGLDSYEYMSNVRFCADGVSAIAEIWREHPETFTWIKRRAVSQTSEVRSSAINSLIVFWKDYDETIELLRDRALNGPDEQLCEWAIEKLKTYDV